MDHKTTNYAVEVFFDGDCPLCKREISFIRKKDRNEQILFRDIQELQLPSPDVPKTHAELMAEIHARLPDGSWIVGVEVFRRIYDAIGWKWLVAPTRLPIIRSLLDWGYRIFAKRRLALTGRCTDSCEAKRS